MSRLTVAARSAAALASLALLAACGDRSGPVPLEPRDAPSFVSAGVQSSDWQQCANNGRNDAIPCEWINSVLNPGKATYREGELIPFRFAVHVVDIQGKQQVAPNPNTTRTVTFTYGFNKGANGNYDFIGKFNQTEGVRANLCSADFAPVNNVYCNPPQGGALAGTLKTPTYGTDQGPLYANPNGTTHSVITIAKSKFTNDPDLPANLRSALQLALDNYTAKGGKLEIDVFGGAGVGVTDVNYNFGGSDVTATITVQFKANQRDVLIAFGAHFARLQDWETIGYNGGAGQSGSPFHIKVDNIDGTTVGALGNNVSGGVVVREANVSLVKTVSASTITVGQSFYWEMTATNNGDGDAVNQTLSDQLPQITGYTFSTPTAGCTISNGVLTCAGITVPANGGTFTARVNATFTGSVTPSTSCGTFPNSATIGGGTPATVNITIQCPTLNVVKVADNLTVSAGSPIGFVLTLNSVGPGTALGATLTDALPTGSGITWTIDAEHSDPGCTLTGSSLSCSYGDLAAGQSRSVHVTSATTAASCQAYPNTVTAQATNHAQVQAQATTTVQCPNLDLTKVADQGTVSAGSTIGFTMTVTNGGDGTAAGVTLTDVLPTNTGLSWTIDAAGSDAGCVIGGNGTLTCTWGDLAKNASKHVHITSPTVFATCGTVNNTANATTTNNGSDQASASVTVQCPALEITKNSDQNTVSAGMPIAFTVIVRNTGAGTATAVTLNDPLPGGTGVSWSINPAYAGPGTCQITGSAPSQTLACSFGNLASGASASVRVASATTAASCKAYVNQASAQATNHAQVQASETITVQCPQLALTKIADAATVSAGDAIGFTMTVTNSGAGTASGVTLTDQLPSNAGLNWSISPTNAACSITGGTLSCSFGSLGPGATASVHITSPTTFASCGTVNNTANVTTTNNGSDQASASVTVQCPALEITKAADAPTVSAGTAIGFSITVRNTGAGIARSVSLNDALPTGTGISWTISPTVAGCSITGSTLACAFGDLANGATRTVHLTSPTTASSCQEYVNTATAQATNHALVQAQASTTVQCPNISLTKVADQGTVSAGTTIGFTMTVTNAGPGTASSVTLTDVLPTNAGLNWTISPAVPGCSIASGTLTCNFGTLGVDSRSVHVSSPTTVNSCGTVSNTASVTTGNDGSDEKSASVTVNCPNLSITKTPSPQTLSAGESFSWTVTLTNSGDGTAMGARINDPLPVVTGVSYELGAGSDASCAITGTTLACGPKDLAKNATLVAVINATTTSGTSCAANGFTNTATGKATGVADVTASATVTLNCPSLSIAKTPDAGDPGYNVKPGDQAVFTITVTNTGLGKAFNTIVTDQLPAGLTWTATPSVGTCSTSNGLLTCLLGTMNASAVATITLTSNTIPADFVQLPDSPAGSALEVKDDGNLQDGAAAGKDWATLDPSVFSCSAPKKGCDVDLPTGTTDNSFGQGTKEDTPIPTVVAGSIPNNKSDLLRFYVATERFVRTDFLYLAWERVQAPNGTTNMDFELNQSKDVSSNNVTPVRTAGDILIKYDLARGGTRPTLGVHTWLTAAYAAAKGLGAASTACEASNAFPCWGKVVDLSNSLAVEASINTTIIPEPIAGGNLDALTFGEASINLQDAGIFKAGTCVSFGQAYLKSRSSDAFSSEIKDFIAPIPIEVKSCKDRPIPNTATVRADGVNATSNSGEILVGNPSGTASLFTAPGSTRVTRTAGGRSWMGASTAAAPLPTASTPTTATATDGAWSQREILRQRVIGWWLVPPAPEAAPITRGSPGLLYPAVAVDT